MSDTPLLDYIAERDEAMQRVARNAGAEFAARARDLTQSGLYANNGNAL